MLTILLISHLLAAALFLAYKAESARQRRLEREEREAALLEKHPELAAAGAPNEED